MEERPDSRQEVDFRCPPGLEAGVYANVMVVWNTGTEFTLDFGVTLPRDRTERTDPGPVPAVVTSRIKVSPTMIFDLMRALSEQLDRYEAQYGRLQQRGSDPEVP